MQSRVTFVYLHGLYLHNVLLLQTLLDDVKGDTHGQFEDILVALITPPAAYDCHEVMRAMKVRPPDNPVALFFWWLNIRSLLSFFKSRSFAVTRQGAGTKDSVLIEIFASRTNEQIQALNEVYLQGEAARRLLSHCKVKLANSDGDTLEYNETDCPHCPLWAEREKKLSFDLKREVSGDFSKALLLLAEVGLSSKTHNQPSCLLVCTLMFAHALYFLFTFRARGRRAPRWTCRRPTKTPRWCEVHIWVVRLAGIVSFYWMSWVLTFCLLFVGSGPSLL